MIPKNILTEEFYMKFRLLNITFVVCLLFISGCDNSDNTKSGVNNSTVDKQDVSNDGMRIEYDAFTLDNGYISEQAKDNIRRVVTELGVDHIFGETPAMNEIFVDSLKQFSNVCNGCFKVLYTLSVQIALEKDIPYIVTGYRGGNFSKRD